MARSLSGLHLIVTSIDNPAANRRRASGRPRGSYAKSEGTRAAILDAALEVFAQGGYRSGSLRDVAVRAGMSEAGLLYHFSDKPALLAAVLQRRDKLAEQFVPSPVGDGAETVRGLIALARYNASVPGVVELYSILSAEATSKDHPANRYFVERYEMTRTTLVAAFTDLQDKDRLRAGVDPEAAARGTVAVMDGLQVQWLLDRSALNMAEDLRVFLRRLTSIDL